VFDPRQGTTQSLKAYHTVRCYREEKKLDFVLSNIKIN